MTAVHTIHLFSAHLCSILSELNSEDLYLVHTINIMAQKGLQLLDLDEERLEKLKKGNL